MKKVITSILMIIVTLLSSTQMSAYDFEVNGLYYEIVDISELTCKVVSGEEKYKGDIVIPAEVEYKSKKFQVVSFSGFRNCSSLTSVTIPNSVTEIGHSAFYDCSSLTSITIPDSVTEIGYAAFFGCSSLTSIIIPDSVTEIEAAAFEDCSSLTSITISNSATEIRNRAFYGCSSLTSITIPNSVTEIEDSAFYDCSSLTSITIPDSVTEIESVAFHGCSSLTSITIPDSVTEIGAAAFEDCFSLTSISLSNNLKSIKCGTFGECKALRSISVPGSVLEIEQYYYSSRGVNSYFLFEGCESLKEIYFFYGNDVLESGYAGVTDHSGTHFYSTSWDISWTKRLEKVFIDRQFREYITLQNLKELTIGEHLTELQISQISNCKDLETIVSYAITPPSSDEFSNKQYMDVIVKVPIEALEAYKADPVWKNFWNLEGFDAGDSAVDSIASDDTVNEIGRYDINGKAVNTDYKGIVIIRYSDGTSRKMLNK